jgi:hypothetical protein
LRTNHHDGIIDANAAPAAMIRDSFTNNEEKVTMSDKTKAEKAQKPVHKVRGGGIEVSIWKNEGANGVWYSVTLRRNYKQGEAWKESDSYAEDDLLRLAKLANEADTWIAGQRQQQRAQKVAA